MSTCKLGTLKRCLSLRPYARPWDTLVTYQSPTASKTYRTAAWVERRRYRLPSLDIETLYNSVHTIFPRIPEGS